MIFKLTVENCFKESAPSMEWFTMMPSLEIREKFYTDDEAILHTSDWLMPRCFDGKNGQSEATPISVELWESFRK